MSGSPGEGRREDVTRILGELQDGALHAADDLLPLVYDELRALARARVAREAQAGATLQPTMLVHEAYLRLVGPRDPGWNGKGHFFGAAAQAMRRILVERARRRGRIKHGAGRERLRVTQIDPESGAPAADDVLAVDEALTRLEAMDPRKARLVTLRYFGGLTNQEAAEALDVSVGTVEREWRFIRAWLLGELGPGSN